MCFARLWQAKRAVRSEFNRQKGSALLMIKRMSATPVQVWHSFFHSWFRSSFKQRGHRFFPLNWNTSRVLSQKMQLGRYLRRTIAEPST